MLMHPDFASGVMNWWDNIPLAGTLMQITQPRIFVELGVCCGDSYMAFNQAARIVSPQTKLFGIDIWEPSEEFPTLRPDHHRLASFFTAHAKFEAQSKLIQKRFDDAIEDFATGSIDLLHIDGDHREAEHDLDTWLPKLSSRAIVMFHDIILVGEKSSMTAVWPRIRARFPHFEFYHGTGLGLIATGPSVPYPLASIFSETSQGSEKLRAFYALLGDLIKALVYFSYSYGPMPESPETETL